ncbi:MAG TPA: AAA domain-containing protein [Micromonosporaceae bacterium]|jgi:very-short-patch-repair endonuclease
MSSTRSKDRDLIATTANLVEFLRDVAMARQKRVVDVADYKLVQWFDGLPSEVRVEIEAGPGETLLSIPRHRPEAPPNPGKLASWLDAEELTNSDLKAPALKEQGADWAIARQTDGTLGTHGKLVTRAEAPGILDSYYTYLEGWKNWAARDRKHKPYRTWYNALAEAARLVREQEDQYELVLGLGLLTWRTPGGTVVRNHLITTRLIAVIDTAKDEVRLMVDPDAATRAQDREVLDGEVGYDPVRVEQVHDQIRDEAVVTPLVDSEALLKLWAERALDSETRYVAEWKPQQVEENPVVRLAPAVVLRRRERASLIGYYDTMLRALRGAKAQAPLGLAQLVTSMEATERLAWLEEEGAASGEVLGADPLFPLPANPEQMRIMERLRGNNGVVVQGPPGTGKTHTIANLMSALLAQGQRVLVTSQKAQALRVLREKLPAEVAKLCVSITDLDRGGSAELEGSVKAMSNRYAGFDPVAHDAQVAKGEQRRHELMTRVDELTEAVRLLRESETYPHPEVVPGYSGTLAEIAGRLRDAAPRLGWVPVPLPDGLSEPPLAAADAAQLLALLTTQTPARLARTNQRPVAMEEYPGVADLEALLAAESSARQVAELGATDVSRHLSSLDEGLLASLLAQVEAARQLTSLLGLGLDATAWSLDDWAVRAIRDGLGGHNATLWAQIGAGRQQLVEAQQALSELGFRDIAVGGPPMSPTARYNVIRPLHEMLQAGGRLRSTFKPVEQRDADPVLEKTTVDGLPITTAEQVDVLHRALKAQAAMETVGRGFTIVGATVTGTPDESVHQSVARVVDLYARLDLVQRFLTAVTAIRTALTTTQSFLPLTSPSEWQDFITALDGVRLRVTADAASAKLTGLAERLAADGAAPDAPPELAQAAVAVAGRDRDGYARAMTGLGAVAHEIAEQARCEELLATLRSRHPALAELLLSTLDSADWSERVAAWDEAFDWARANTFFQQQRQVGREQQLEAELADTISRLRQEAASLAAVRAWGHCLRRMTAHQAQALQAYEQHMRALGKGTGKYAAKFRSLARQAMREARNAVPAWIMPLDVVLETLAPIRDSFDVVIVDEASQASIEDLFLLWLAPRVIVVGDDKQCAPSQVRLGELEPIFSKLNAYLPDLPGYLRDAFTPRSSLFDLLRTRFGAVIPLREHFRCMPEIIEFSSRQFYADEPLVPLRQFGADRLPPLRAVRVQTAVTEGSNTRLRNPVEAEAIVSQIEQCLADPAYAGKTMGVVVLQGTGQVQLLQRLLLERVDPKEWEARRLRVGTPPDFQGDERDVIFVSLVIAEKRAAITGTEWQRRFNVAASRARDQLWLFHSIGLDQLTPIDLRASLLAYVLNPPPALLAEPLVDVTPDEPHPAFRSLFDQRVFCRVAAKGYHVTPQVQVNGRSIDLVVTGAKGRLAIGCDGRSWPGTAAQHATDLDRERELQRAGWRFWRVRESEFRYDPEVALGSLWSTLRKLGITKFDPADFAGVASSASEWTPAALSAVEGLDGLDGDSPEELDDLQLAR